MRNHLLKKNIVRLFLTFSSLVIVGIIFSTPLLTSVSRALVYQDSLIKSEALVVLVGSTTGNRIKEAVRLLNEGFADKLVFSGFEVYPETHSSALMKTYAMKLGVPENKIIARITDEEVSTRGESIANLKLLKDQQIKSFILVTSAFHTRRSHLIYKKSISILGQDVTFCVHPAKDPLAPIHSWWKLRTGLKMIFYEYLKSLAYYF